MIIFTFIGNTKNSDNLITTSIRVHIDIYCKHNKKYEYHGNNQSSNKVAEDLIYTKKDHRQNFSIIIIHMFI